MNTTINNLVSRIVKHHKKLQKKFDKCVVLSLGENCLPDNILARNSLKSFSSPYASGRSNIEYILHFEKERFADFLNPVYLCYELMQGKKVVRNKKYVDVNNNYHYSCIWGFEFTHHDVIRSSADRRRINRRCWRMLKLHRKHIVLLYYHRLCDDTDYCMLLLHLNELADIYEKRDNEVDVVLFYQVLVKNESQRKVEYSIKQGIHIFAFFSLKEWSGDNGYYFWATCDDDLISKMITEIKETIISKT